MRVSDWDATCPLCRIQGTYQHRISTRVMSPDAAKWLTDAGGVGSFVHTDVVSQHLIVS